jgi:predicted nucleic acid-binding protein
MTGPDFLDTNVAIYAFDTSHPEKQKVSRALLKSAVAGKAVISTQVLAEFSAALLHKVSPRVSADAVAKGLDALAPIRTILPDVDLIRRAVEAHAAYGIHFYDGMIVAAAERAGCERIWSEDLSEGQEYFGVTVANPFRDEFQGIK